MITNPLKGEVPVAVASGTYRFVFSIEALIVLEALFGKTIAEIGQALKENLPAAEIRTLFWAGLQEWHPDVDHRAAGRIASELGLGAASLLIVRAFALAFDAGPATSPPDAPAADPAAGASGAGAGGTGASASAPGAASSSENPTPSGG